ncbi:MAG TPA: hypothetical protein P5186_27750 [Candidatus Paceibacterota bacterium]|nr:hypothetical protein [Verrucomicrobiota bacterium]HRY51846.1 hypothetical protein [Candidatus Paceibacterota bacterium]
MTKTIDFGTLTRLVVAMVGLMSCGAMGSGDGASAPLQARLNPMSSGRNPEVIVSWSGNFSLEQTASLASPIQWEPVASRVALEDDGQRSVVIPAGKAYRFYRLRSEPLTRVPTDVFRSIGYNDLFDDSSEVYLMSNEERFRLGIRLEPQIVGKVPAGILRPQPIHKLRVHAIRTANDNGSEAATITADEVKLLVDQANVVYYSSGIEFVFDPAQDFETRNSTLLNHDFTTTVNGALYTHKDVEPPTSAEESAPHTAERTRVANLYPGKIVFYFRWGDRWRYDDDLHHWVLKPASGGSSSWAAPYVNMTRGLPEKNLLAHEVGHYLHNRHPFVSGIETVEEAADVIRNYLQNHSREEGLDALDGDRDFVLDTPADVGQAIFDNATPPIPTCQADAELEIPIAYIPPTPIPLSQSGSSIGYLLKPDKHNIMSYFKHCHALGHWLSDDQTERTRDGLENGNRHRLISEVFTRPTLVKQDELKGEVMSNPQVVRTRFRQLVTVFKTSDNRLRLVAWHANADGQLQRKGQIEGLGTIWEVTATGLGLGLVATTVKTSDLNLKTIIWRVNTAGQFTRLGDHELEGVILSGFRSCPVGIEHFAVAGARVWTSGGQSGSYLKVYVWKVTASGEPTLVAEAAGGHMDFISLCPLGRENQFATAFQDNNGNLKIIAWRLVEKTQLIRTDEAAAGAVGRVAAVGTDVDLLTTVVQTSSGKIKLINWKYDEDGKLTRAGELTGGDVFDVHAARLGIDMIATASLSNDSNLELALWKITDGGNTITHAKSVVSIPVWEAVPSIVDSGKLAVVTGGTLADRAMRVMVYRTETTFIIGR